MAGELMKAEMLEQPRAIKRTLLGAKAEVEEAAQLMHDKFIYTTGSGTSYHASLVLQRSLTRIAGTSSVAIPASELEYWIPEDVSGSILVAISQSGESSDIIRAIKAFKSKGGSIIGITNTPRSTLSKLANKTILTRAGEERAVAATKTYTCQLAAAFLLSIEVSKSMGNNPSDLESRLLSLPNDIANEIKIADESSRKIVPILVKRPVGFILGTGPNYPTALEGALKLRETSNLFIQAFAGREFLHGPIQLISRNTPTIVLEPEKMPVITKRIVGYGAPLITLGKEADLLVKYEGPEEFYPIPYIIPLQFLALYVSLAKGLNPDKPEKLGKVVR